MRKTLSTALAAVFLLFLFSTAPLADEPKEEKGTAPAGPATMEELRERVQKLEERIKNGVITDEFGHKYHPIHSIYGLKIGGGLTLVGQGTGHLKTGASRGALSLSGDIALESPVGDSGRAVAVFDFQSGGGLSSLPTFFASPNGNTSGPNADIESFNNDSLHMTQLYYEHESGGAAVSIGKLDPTAYFDTNNYANNERSQFLANIFTNNPAIEFGGTADFYSPGLRVTYSPLEAFGFTAAVLEGDGDFSNSFDSPFVIAEADYAHRHGEGMEGNFRIYYWQRNSRPDASTTANPADPSLAKEKNRGVGVSIDHTVTEKIALWLRAGTQSEKVAQFDTHVSAGAHAGGLFGRENDALGIAYGATFMGKDYEEFRKASNPGFEASTEHYLEAYYNIAVKGATDITGLHVSPDVQFVKNPGGNKDMGEVFIYGLRVQAFF